MNDNIPIRPEDATKATKAKAAAPTKAKHWRAVRDADGIETLTFDRADSRSNTLGRAVVEELEAAVDALEADPPKGLIVASGKDDHFAYGADVTEFEGLSDAEEVEGLIRRVHALFDRLEALDCPTVAMIHGPCLGGGLELALACDHRVGSREAKVGFPEIQVGIHPGFGGTARAVRLLPAPQAMQLMLTARTLDARRAKAAGLLDEVQPRRHLEAAARAAVVRGFGRRHPHWKTWLLNTLPARLVLAELMRRRTAQKVRASHYPAPFALIDLWERSGGSKAKMLEAEARSVSGLITGRTAQNLVRVFGLRERLKHAGGKQASAVRHVHVVGAGVMGGDIAGWCAMRGLRVSLSDIDEAQIGRAIGRARDLFRKQLREPAKVRDALDRLMADPERDGLHHADLVIEAVAERLDVKQTVFKDIVARAPKDALLATNTSSIPLEDIAQAVDKPGRLVGLHFFNPVAKLPLVEIVRGEKTHAKTAAAAAAFADSIGKLPLPVKSAPGFLVNRALSPYMLEAMLMLEEGVAAETIDAAAEKFGMPVGPVELADSVGLDIALEVGAMLAEGSGIEAPERLRVMVDNGKLGKKSGRGFYVWKDGKAQKGKAGEPPADAADRLILPMVNTFAACVREGVVEDADLADAGAVFGTGFAPFRGGPINYACERGTDDVRTALARLTKEYGSRFEPDPFWQQSHGEGPAKERGTGKRKAGSPRTRAGAK